MSPDCDVGVGVGAGVLVGGLVGGFDGGLVWLVGPPDGAGPEP